MTFKTPCNFTNKKNAWPRRLYQLVQPCIPTANSTSNPFFNAAAHASITCQCIITAAHRRNSARKTVGAAAVCKRDGPASPGNLGACMTIGLSIRVAANCTPRANSFLRRTPDEKISSTPFDVLFGASGRSYRTGNRTPSAWRSRTQSAGEAR